MPSLPLLKQKFNLEFALFPRIRQNPKNINLVHTPAPKTSKHLSCSHANHQHRYRSLTPGICPLDLYPQSNILRFRRTGFLPANPGNTSITVAHLLSTHDIHSAYTTPRKMKKHPPRIHAKIVYPSRSHAEKSLFEACSLMRILYTCKFKISIQKSPKKPEFQAFLAENATSGTLMPRSQRGLSTGTCPRGVLFLANSRRR